jgi:hypothetical protein
MLKRTLSITMLLTFALFVAGCADYQSADPGKIGVVRGSPSETGSSDTKDKKIKQIICPDDERVDVGDDVVTRYYHEKRSQRYYLITREEGRGDRPGADYVEVTTADGVLVKIEGKFYFNTNFDCSKKGKKLLEQFDYQYGSRGFPVLGGGGTDSDKTAAPHQGADGWGAFLDINVRPEIDNVMLEQVGNVACKDINPQCAIVSKGGQVLADANEGKDAIKNRKQVEAAIVEALNLQLEESMGAPYLTFTDFRIAKVSLPQGVQDAVNSSQAEFAALNKKEAELQNAKLEAQRQELLSKAYETSPALLQLEIARINAAAQQEIAKTLASGSSPVEFYYGVDPRK